MSVAW